MGSWHPVKVIIFASDTWKKTNVCVLLILKFSCTFVQSDQVTRMVDHGQLVEPAVCLSYLYDVFVLDIVKDTTQNLWAMIYRSK